MKVYFQYMLNGTIELDKSEIKKVNNEYKGSVKDYLVENYNMYNHASNGELKEVQYDRKEMFKGGK